MCGVLITASHISPLCRLRDITQETELEQRRRIAEMEKDVTTLDDIQSTCSRQSARFSSLILPK